MKKKWNLEDEDDIMCRNRFDIQIGSCGGEMNMMMFLKLRNI